ncbi:unnamed protein product [Paramecium pentaurelia]|uniref:J domain-containing protein n=1 Tax=Paramecium pentaurelia TaxID=43138 RepID=A0A8S1T1B5_9CILI|nr:unnamed protein product [Paramecium pentaurelia]
MIQVSEVTLQEALAKKEEGNKFFAEKKYDEAIKCYSEAIDHNPNEPIYYSNRAACYIPLRQYKKALDDTEQALKRDSNNVKTLRRKAIALQNLGRLEECVNSLNAALQITPGDQSLKQEYLTAQQAFQSYQEGLKQIQNEDYQKALYQFQQVIQVCSQSLEIQILFVECLAKCGENERASKWLMQIQSEHGTTPDVYYLKGIIDLYNGNSERAKKILIDGMKVDPDNKKCREALKKARKCEELKEKGNQLLQQVKLNDAIECYTEALSVDPYNRKINSIIYANRGLVKQKMSQHKEAIEDFTKSIELNPQYYKALMRRAESYDKLGQFGESVHDYQQVIQIEPSLEQEMAQKLREAQKKEKLAKKKDYYKILEVGRDATENEIKKSYRKLALLWHPDKLKDKDEETKQIGQQKFRDIAEAYAVLSDKKKKELFDSGVDPNDQSGGFDGGVDPTQVFQMFFGGGGGFQQFPFGGSGVRFEFR